jgi:hypothetical protein
MSAARGDPVRSAETAVVSFVQPSWFVRQPPRNSSLSLTIASTFATTQTARAH